MINIFRTITTIQNQTAGNRRLVQLWVVYWYMYRYIYKRIERQKRTLFLCFIWERGKPHFGQWMKLKKVRCTWIFVCWSCWKNWTWEKRIWYEIERYRERQIKNSFYPFKRGSFIYLFRIAFCTCIIKISGIDSKCRLVNYMQRY